MPQRLTDTLTLELTREQLILFRNNFPEAAQNLIRRAAKNAEEQYLRDPATVKRTKWEALKHAWNTNSVVLRTSETEVIPKDKIENAQELQALQRISNNWVDRENKKKVAAESTARGQDRSLSQTRNPVESQSQTVTQEMAAGQARAHKVWSELPKGGLPFQGEAKLKNDHVDEQRKKRGVKIS